MADQYSLVARKDVRSCQVQRPRQREELGGSYGRRRCVDCHFPGYIRLELTCLLDTEPYDEALDRELCDLRSDRREWDLRIAKRRRTAPGMVQDLVQDLLERQRAVEYKIQEPKLDDMEVDFERMCHPFGDTIALHFFYRTFVQLPCHDWIALQINTTRL